MGWGKRFGIELGKVIGIGNSVQQIARVALTVLGFGAIHFLGFATAAGDPLFTLLDATFLFSFWLVFFSTVSVASMVGALVFISFRGLFLASLSVLLGWVQFSFLRRFSRVVAVILRRGHWDAYISITISLIAFSSFYLGTGILLSCVTVAIPFLILRGTIYSSDAFLYVASRRLRGREKYTSGFSLSYE